jgi:hypothetical protein
MKIDFKTQTPRSTKFHTGKTNINLFCNGLELGIVTSKYWGDFESRKEPLIQMEIKGQQYQINQSKFEKIIKKNFKSFKVR